MENYEDENFNIREDSDYEEDLNEVVKYTRIEYRLDEMMENIYNDVIVPYLDCICQKEILDDLDEFTVGRFINFFKLNSTYYKYVLNKLDEK